MMKNKLNFLVALITISLLSLNFVSAISMTRTAPSTATSGSTFVVTYTVSGGIGTWGASIVDNVVGGCKFPGGVTQLKTVMLSSDGNTKTITITAPASGSCIFTGDYKFGTDAIVNFATATTTIGGTCTDTSWSPDTSTVCSGTSFTQTSNCGNTKTSIGTKTGCTTPVCSEFFSNTMNWYAFSDNDCTNGYIMTAILVIGIILLIVILKK